MIGEYGPFDDARSIACFPPFEFFREEFQERPGRTIHATHLDLCIDYLGHPAGPSTADEEVVDRWIFDEGGLDVWEPASSEQLLLATSATVAVLVTSKALYGSVLSGSSSAFPKDLWAGSEPTRRNGIMRTVAFCWPLASIETIRTLRYGGGQLLLIEGQGARLASLTVNRPESGTFRMKGFGFRSKYKEFVAQIEPLHERARQDFPDFTPYKTTGTRDTLSATPTPTPTPTATPQPPKLGLMVNHPSRDGYYGLEVTMVAAGSISDRIGIRIGDDLLKVADVRIQELGDLSQIMASKRPGDSIPVEWRRGSEHHEQVVLL